jgi:integrase
MQLAPCDKRIQTQHRKKGWNFLRQEGARVSIRKRIWKSSQGVEKEAWVLDYVDQTGQRRLKTFARKKDAEAFETTVREEVRLGVHTADSASLTVAEAGKLWIDSARNAGLERSTIEQYEAHLKFHIAPFLGQMKLSQLTAPIVREFEDRLRNGIGSVVGESLARSPAMVKKARGSLSSLIGDAQERGLVARNVVRDLRARRKPGKERQAERRQRGKLRVGIDIPSREEIKAIVGHLSGRWRPILLTAIFTGLRASELRGLRWADVDLVKRELHVRQRADRYNAIGAPKSESGNRVVPLPPLVLSALKEWKLRAPKSALDLVFPTNLGTILSHGNLINRALIPVQIAAGVTVTEKRPQGRPIIRAKYTGLHSLRHFYASWCINPKSAGGLELPPKVVQEHLGHSSIVMTMDTYGHLFPRGDDSAQIAAAERALLA